jgi:drug/metabolite transporter (DMT)-like permease
MLAIVVPLALIAALCYAISDFLEQRAAQRNAASGPSDLALGRRGARGVAARVLAAAAAAGDTLRRLARDRLWFAGWAVGTLAYLIQAVALHIGSVSVVQALQVTSLIFILPLSTIGTPRRPGPRDWVGAACVCAGLVLFLTVRGRTPAASEAHRGRILFLLLMLLAGIAALAVLAALRSGPIRATLLACAAGASFASSAALVKLTSRDLVQHGVPHTATDWPGYALAGVTVLGVLLQQVAFASGRLPVAATAMVVTNPVLGGVIAVLGFGEPLPGTPARLAGVAVGGALVASGVAVLAHSPLLADRSSDADRTRAMERAAQGRWIGGGGV